MSSRSKQGMVTLGLTLGAALAGYGLHANAEGAPMSQPLWYGGEVSDQAGAALEGNHKVSLKLFPVDRGGDAACSAGPIDTSFSKGRFRVDVSACAEAVKKQPDLYAELIVDDDSKPFPRVKVGAVPYSLEAAHALSAGQADGALKRQLDSLPKITDWESFTPSILLGGQPIAAPEGTSASWRRVGDSIELRMNLDYPEKMVGNGPIHFKLPNGLDVDTKKLLQFSVVGNGLLYQDATGYLWNLTVVYRPENVFGLVFENHAGAVKDAFDLTMAQPFAINSGGSFQITLSAPIAGWGTPKQP